MTAHVRSLSVLGAARGDRTIKIGLIFVLVVVLLLAGMVFKTQIVAVFRGGHTVTADFAGSYNLRPDRTKVKVGGLEVGVVTSVDHLSNGVVRVKMKVNDDANKALGPKPSAAIEPLTILGGGVKVNLKPGGGRGKYAGATIPLSRTRLPSELDRILDALPADTRTALQGVLARADRTLDVGGGASIRRLVRSAPQAFAPAAEVFQAALGTPGSNELGDAVDSIYSISTVLSRRNSELGRIVDDLDATTSVLARNKESVSSTLAAMPHALATTRSTMAALQVTLSKLDQTSDDLGPTASEAEPLVSALVPAIQQLRPLVSDLRPAIADARPILGHLVPVTRQANEVLVDLRGPVLDRVNGPILDVLSKPWHGEGPYAKSGRGIQADHKFYEEIAYMITNLDRSSMVQDHQGSLLNFAVGVGLGSVANSPASGALNSLSDALYQLAMQQMERSR